MSEQSVSEIDTRPQTSDVEILPVTPFLVGNLSITRSIFDAYRVHGTKALILTGYATGSTPAALNPFIKEAVEGGMAVFVLSDNTAENTGPQRIKYGVQQDAVDAGATLLKDVNINKGEEVFATVRQAIADGKTGQELTQAVVDKYGTPMK